MEKLSDGRGNSKGRVVTCGEVERVIFPKGAEHNNEDLPTSKAVDDMDQDATGHDGAEASDNSDGGVPVSSPRSPTEVSVDLHTDSRVRGMQRAKDREMVRQAARRGATLGFFSWDADRDGVPLKVEAVQNGKIVEASFAKGEWGVRWRN